MQFDWNQINQGGQLDRILSALPYPLDKEEVIQHAQASGVNPTVLNAIKQVLPENEFNSPEDIKKCIQRGSQQKH